MVQSYQSTTLVEKNRTSARNDSVPIGDRLRDVKIETGIGLSNIRSAAERLQGITTVTPVLSHDLMDEILSLGATRFFFKMESLQHTGSFKLRGAYNAMAVMAGPREFEPGMNSGILHPIVTHSSGNHGRAVAYAARLLGYQAYIVLPCNIPREKLDGVRMHCPTEIIMCGPSDNERATTATTVANRVGGFLLHSSSNADVIAGQGTIALELLEQVHDLDGIIVPIGSGGMISGIAIAAKTLAPNIQVIGAEPANADDAARSLKSGSHVRAKELPTTFADGLRCSLGTLGWSVLSNLVDSVLTVSEEDIIAATKLVWSTLNVVVEPSAGVGVAVAMSEEFRLLGLKRVAIVLCGGNFDINSLP